MKLITSLHRQHSFYSSACKFVFISLRSLRATTNICKQSSDILVILQLILYTQMFSYSGCQIHIPIWKVLQNQDHISIHLYTIS